MALRISLYKLYICKLNMGRAKRIWYLSPMRAAKVQASLRIRAVSPEPPLLAHTSSESRGPFRQKARSLAPLNGWACAVNICHGGMLEDTNSLDAAHMSYCNCMSGTMKPSDQANCAPINIFHKKGLFRRMCLKMFYCSVPSLLKNPVSTVGKQIQWYLH